MSNLFLIAHKVRGEAAFDVAEQMTCPICSSMGHGPNETGYATCDECNGEGYWWIIPTSGHRAYPIMYWTIGNLYNLLEASNGPSYMRVLDEAGPWEAHPDFASAPDHYPMNKSKEAKSSGHDLLAQLGLKRKQPVITRRF